MLFRINMFCVNCRSRTAHSLRMSTAFRVQSIPIEMNGKIYGILKIGTPALGSLNLTWEVVFVLALARLFLIKYRIKTQSRVVVQRGQMREKLVSLSLVLLEHVT